MAPPAADQFADSSIAVTAGSVVSLHWSTPAGANPPPGEYFLLTSVAPGALPGFGSNSVVGWPANTSEGWNSTYGFWATTADAMSVAIPPTSPVGTTYAIQVDTCSLTTQECSQSPGGTGPVDGTTSLTVAPGWSAATYTRDFRTVRAFPETSGEPLDVTFSPDGTLWNTSEFSNTLDKSGATAKAFVDPSNVAIQPFASCFSLCSATSLSALSERVIAANGRIWFTFGGWGGYSPSVPVPDNHSEVVSFDPSTKKFCTYLVPGSDNEVVGLAATGTAPDALIWFTESRGNGGQPTLDDFNPALLGDGCPGLANELFTLPATLQRVPWPASVSGGPNWPSHLAVDPTSPSLWVTDLFGSEIDRVTMATGQITRYPLGTPTNASSSLGSEPWEIVVDQHYVYAVEYGDSELVRINKTTGQIDEVRLPLTSDTEQAHSLALLGGKLYFTLSDDDRPSFGAASTFGYVDIAAWEAASAPCSTTPGDCAPAPAMATVYTGLSSSVDPLTGTADFRGIATSPSGTVAIADLHQVIRLKP